MGPPDRRNKPPTFIVANRKTFQATKSIESLLHQPGTHSVLPPCKPKGLNSSSSNCVCAQHPNAAPPKFTWLYPKMSKDEGRPSLAEGSLAFDMALLKLVAGRLWGLP